MDWTTGWAAAAAFAGSVAAVYAGLTFHRNTASGHLVRWTVELDDSEVILVCHGPGIATDIQASFSEGFIPSAQSTHKRSEMHEGSRARLGRIFPQSAYQPVGEVRVEYTRTAPFGRTKRETWRSELI